MTITLRRFNDITIVTVTVSDTTSSCSFSFLKDSDAEYFITLVAKSFFL